MTVLPHDAMLVQYMLSLYVRCHKPVLYQSG